jgi:hypothetical protein
MKQQMDDDDDDTVRDGDALCVPIMMADARRFVDPADDRPAAECRCGA